jgi:hypothetical protein
MEHTTRNTITHRCGSRPIQFEGTEEEAIDNFLSHQFTESLDDRCPRCDAKPWYAAARYPCGDEPPRERFGDCNACDLELPYEDQFI